MLREVTNGTAVLEGPNGIWTVKRGDMVPGVGRVRVYCSLGQAVDSRDKQGFNFDAVRRSLIACSRKR